VSNGTKDAILSDIISSLGTVKLEVSHITRFKLNDSEIGERLIYLFQKDLLPGINGQILETKKKRDSVQNDKIALHWKLLCWLFIICLNCAMLFYIYLFAIRQSAVRQKAWFQSFITWLLFEITLVSTLVVYITHFLLPSYIAKDVIKIKMKLLDTIREFRTNSEYKNSDNIFNATQYLFASTRLAEKYPNLRESQIIMKFSTPWPIHSYSNRLTVSRTYSKKYSFLTTFISIIAIYVIKGLIYLPPSIQDILYQFISTSGLGYMIIVFIQLYRIYPILPLIPILGLIIIITIVIKYGNNRDTFAALAKIVPLSGNTNNTNSNNSNTKQEDNNNNNNKVEEDGKDEHPNISNHITRRQSVQNGLMTLDQLDRHHRPIPAVKIDAWQSADDASIDNTQRVNNASVSDNLISNEYCNSNTTQVIDLQNDINTDAYDNDLNTNTNKTNSNNYESNNNDNEVTTNANNNSSNNKVEDVTQSKIFIKRAQVQLDGSIECISSMHSSDDDDDDKANNEINNVNFNRRGQVQLNNAVEFAAKHSSQESSDASSSYSDSSSNNSSDSSEEDE
jgi:hypothetical protein